MTDKETVYMEISLTTGKGSTSFVEFGKDADQPQWKSLGMFTGTGAQIEKELVRRVKQYKKDNNIKK